MLILRIENIWTAIYNKDTPRGSAKVDKVGPGEDDQRGESCGVRATGTAKSQVEIRTPGRAEPDKKLTGMQRY